MKRSPRRLDILQGGNPKCAGAGHPHVPKDELAGKKTILAEQRSLSGTQENRHLWKKGQATQADYKDVVRLCREKMTSAKVQLGFHLASAVKDNKQGLSKSINNKKRAK